MPVLLLQVDSWRHHVLRESGLVYPERYALATLLPKNDAKINGSAACMVLTIKSTSREFEFWHSSTRDDQNITVLDYRKTRTHAVTTPQLCQDRKVAAIRDACNRRGLRVPFFIGFFFYDATFLSQYPVAQSGFNAAF